MQFQGMVRFEGPAFNSVPDLVAYQLKSGLPVTARSQVILKTPVAKETWELNNDDVVLIEKIGRVRANKNIVCPIYILGHYRATLAMSTRQN